MWCCIQKTVGWLVGHWSFGQLKFCQWIYTVENTHTQDDNTYKIVCFMLVWYVMKGG